jgi:hypothetical protein
LTPACCTPAEAFIARFLARVPADLRASFTPAQLTTIQHAFGMRYTMEHALDLRRHVRLPWARYYLVVLCGRDYRPREPSSRRPHRVAFWRHAAVLATLAAGVALFLAK